MMEWKKGHPAKKGTFFLLEINSKRSPVYPLIEQTKSVH